MGRVKRNQGQKNRTKKTGRDQNAHAADAPPGAGGHGGAGHPLLRRGDGPALFPADPAVGISAARSRDPAAQRHHDFPQPRADFRCQYVDIGPDQGSLHGDYVPEKYSGRGNAGDDRGGARDPARRGPGETAGAGVGQRIPVQGGQSQNRQIAGRHLHRLGGGEEAWRRIPGDHRLQAGIPHEQPALQRAGLRRGGQSRQRGPGGQV